MIGKTVLGFVSDWPHFFFLQNLDFNVKKKKSEDSAICDSDLIF